MTEPALEDCPECDGHVHRVIQPVGIVFKGSGFYVTDNRSKSSTALPGKKESDTDSSGGDDGNSSKESSASGADAKSESSKSTAGPD
jgi:predicted nucleic acid-binding Zn ribbon protein